MFTAEIISLLEDKLRKQRIKEEILDLELEENYILYQLNHGMNKFSFYSGKKKKEWNEKLTRCQDCRQEKEQDLAGQSVMQFHEIFLQYNQGLNDTEKQYLEFGSLIEEMEDRCHEFLSVLKDNFSITGNKAPQVYRVGGSMVNFNMASKLYDKNEVLTIAKDFNSTITALLKKFNKDKKTLRLNLVPKLKPYDFSLLFKDNGQYFYFEIEYQDTMGGVYSLLNQLDQVKTEYLKLLLGLNNDDQTSSEIK